MFFALKKIAPCASRHVHGHALNEDRFFMNMSMCANPLTLVQTHEDLFLNVGFFAI
jgi:hypothetical protein